jgi:hypothetical protein
MADTDRIASIADASKPNAGRIYDYVLGGSHNFEVDRIAAQQVLKLSPVLPRMARVIRWFLGEAIRRFVADGFTQFIDFASGLPTVDHIHQVAPPTTRVIYSDLDPVTVAYGQEIIKNNPNASYVVCNIATPEHLLTSPVVSKLIDKTHKVGIGYNGVAWFVKDEDVRHSMQVLYDWAEKGCRLYISDSGFETSLDSSATQEVRNLYNKFGQPVSLRSRDALIELCRPWKVVEPGFKPLEEWIGTKSGVKEESLNSFGMNLIGAFLEK